MHIIICPIKDFKIRISHYCNYSACSVISVVQFVIRFVTDARHPVDDANPRDPERTHSQSQGRGEAGDAPLHSFCRTRVCRLQHRDDAQRQQKEKVFKKNVYCALRCHFRSEMQLRGKSVRSWCDGSSDRSFMGWTHWAIYRSSQCSTTGVTKAVVCAILSVGWCI